MNEKLKIGDICEINITDISSTGEGIGRSNGFTLFASGILPGETAKVQITKMNKNFGLAETIEKTTLSDKRISPPCQFYENCGGCNIMHLDYEEGLKYKGSGIVQNLKRIGKVNSIENIKITPSPEIFHYRNNMQFPVGYDRNSVYVGLYSNKSHIVIPVDNCILADKGSSQVIQIVEQFLNETGLTAYDTKTGRGTVRHISYRTNKHLTEKMVTIVINADSLKNSDTLAERLSTVEGMKSINVNINKNPNSPTFGHITKNIWGQEGYITDFIGKYQFRVAPDAFFQVNPHITDVMYKKVLEFANPTKSDEVIDAYCGAGTISIFISEYVKKVIGVDISESSIANANTNSALNSILNTEFIHGDATDVIPNLLNKGKRPNIIIVDPPRKGLNQKMINAIKSAKIRKIVYVSCDNATLARDIKQFSEVGYSVKGIEAFDMFCWSCHVETVCLLEL